MARYFNNREVELLAPAGNFEIFKEVIRLNCDAVYFGGKNLNMRLHRKDYNFSNEELLEAVSIAHELGKKAYITVNNMYNDEETEELKEFLFYLESVKPDAIIVQDISVIALIKEYNLSIPVHASVMMNVHNLNSINVLRELGVTRVVLSREATLDYSRYLSGVSDMELEYFIHGDMCVAHGGRCLYSGMLFGQSSNRGRCLKPCRWEFETNQNNKEYKTEFPLAVKDMFMYENIPELIHGGITSFKIEGRMRDINYLTMIVNAYGDAIDRYIEEPLSYVRDKDSKELYENRKRDTSTGYAFGRPGLKNINRRYEGTGTLFSSGKVFSTATEERGITEEKIDKIKEQLNHEEIRLFHDEIQLKNNGERLKDSEESANVVANRLSYVSDAKQKEKQLEGQQITIDNSINTRKPRLSVKVNNFEQARACLRLGVDDVYLSGDVFKPDRPFKRSEIKELSSIKGDSKIYLGMPHMVFDEQFAEYAQFLSHDSFIDGILATNIGGLKAFSNYKIIGDYQLNLLNQKAAGLYRSLGVKSFTISPETKLPELIPLLGGLKEEAELIVHGSPTVMYMEHDLYENVEESSAGLLYLKDEGGFMHPVHKDQYGRCHMLLYKNICYLPVLQELYKAGLSNFRLEIPHFSLEETEAIVRIYKNALMDLTTCEELYKELSQKNQMLTFAALGL
ncbi:MAG: family peptidase [Anaerocolumna sp.]|jgi:putative protease|nr:family peptidase [Anaerocolumna sp.]